MVRFALAGVLMLALAGGAHAAGNPTQFLVAQARGNAIVRDFRITEFAQVVRASWYGGGERLNRHTSTGEVFRPWARTAAHRSLPFGTRLEVTDLATGRRTIVRVNDRGPAAWTGRALDLSRGAASDLGMLAVGEARVAIRIVN